MDSIFIKAQREADYNVYLEIRHRYESGCATKRVYKKFEVAEYFRICTEFTIAWSGSRKRLHVYRCEFCAGWHVGRL